MTIRVKAFWMALAIIGLALYSQIKIYGQPVPKLPNIVVIPETNATFFAVTAVGANGLESDFSNEVSTETAGSVGLAWDAPVSTNVIADYRVYFGSASRTYTHLVRAGTNLYASVSLPAVPPTLTNVVLTVTATRATNIVRSFSLNGPWSLLGTTNWTRTNPPAPSYFRAMGRSGCRMAIAFHMQ